MKRRTRHTLFRSSRPLCKVIQCVFQGRNSYFRYEFDWNPETIFALDEVTGEVTVARPRKLDRERRAQWEIRVSVEYSANHVKEEI
jgi:hypothetical protein